MSRTDIRSHRSHTFRNKIRSESVGISMSCIVVGGAYSRPAQRFRCCYVQGEWRESRQQGLLSDCALSLRLAVTLKKSLRSWLHQVKGYTPGHLHQLQHVTGFLATLEVYKARRLLTSLFPSPQPSPLRKLSTASPHTFSRLGDYLSTCDAA